MIRLAANLSLLFTELPFLERFAAARAAGFRAVECQFPYDWDAQDIRRRLDACGLQLVLFNLPPGDFAAGDRGLAALPARVAEFRDTIAPALEFARTTRCTRLHVMAGIPEPAATPAQATETFISNVRLLCDAAHEHGIVIQLEPLNPRDFPGYFLASPERAVELIGQIVRRNLRLQYDFYHCQLIDGPRHRPRLERWLPLIGHVQVAGVPGRHEPDTGDFDPYAALATLEQLGYQGWVGCEYRPAGATVAGLKWAARYGIAAVGSAAS